MLKINEILTYEIYSHHNSYYLSVPVQNLINPKFLLKNDSLYIFLYNYSRGYVINKLTKDIVKLIINEKCYLREAINPKIIEHKINLSPFN